MKEVEVKIQTESLESAEKKLIELGGTISAPKTQKDTVFIPIGASAPLPSGMSALRIREQNGKFIFNLKQTQTNELDCIEYETEIADPKALTEIIQLLGYQKCSYVEKTRRTCKLGEYEICLDEVVDLGSFVEVEKLTDEADSAKVQKELLDFASTLGVDPTRQVFQGYDNLLKNKLT